MNDQMREPDFFRWIRAARRKHDKAMAGMTPERRAELCGLEAVELSRAFDPVEPREARERLDVLLSEPARGGHISDAPQAFREAGPRPCVIELPGLVFFV